MVGPLASLVPERPSEGTLHSSLPSLQFRPFELSPGGARLPFSAHSQTRSQVKRET